ncbi:MAG: hypothetical protein WAU78_15950 [Roseiarcus sp.]
MVYRYVPMLRSKAGEADALGNLSVAAKKRIFPVFHVTASPPITFAVKLGKAWTGQSFALDGSYNFEVTGSSHTYVSLFNSLQASEATAIPAISSDADPQYVKIVQALLTKYGPRLVVKTSLAKLPIVVAWVGSNRWKQADIDLIISAGHAADYESGTFDPFVIHAISAFMPSALSWASITLSASSAPKDYGGLHVGRNDVPRQDWSLWQAVHPHLAYQIDYGDWTTINPDMTEPPGVAMVRASVSVRYATDANWIIMKGVRTTGPSGKTMDTQYRGHAKALVADPLFGGLKDCQADDRIAKIAAGAPGAGSRATWVELGIERHLALVADRLP